MFRFTYFASHFKESQFIFLPSSSSQEENCSQSPILPRRHLNWTFLTLCRPAFGLQLRADLFIHFHYKEKENLKLLQIISICIFEPITFELGI